MLKTKYGILNILLIFAVELYSLAIHCADASAQNHLIVITAPSNYGKTTTACELQKALDEGVAHLSFDPYFQQSGWIAAMGRASKIMRPGDIADKWGDFISNLASYEDKDLNALKDRSVYLKNFFEIVNKNKFSPAQVVQMYEKYDCENDFYGDIRNTLKTKRIVIIDHYLGLELDKWNAFVEELKSKNTRLSYIFLTSDFESFQKRYKERNASSNFSDHELFTIKKSMGSSSEEPAK